MIIKSQHFFCWSSAMFWVGILSLITLWLLVRYGCAATPDSISYLIAAKKFSAGQGFIVPDLVFTNSDFYKPMVAWPPLYPAALSFFVTVAGESSGHANWLNVICLIWLMVVFSVALKRTINQPFCLLLCAGLLLFNQTIITIYSHIWSEVLFIPLVFSSFLCLIKFMESDNKLILILSALFLVGAVYTRYIGVVFIVPVIGTLLFFKKPLAVRTGLMIIYFFIFGLGVTGLAFRNYSLTGFWGGEPRADSALSLLHNLSDLASVLNQNSIGLFGLFFLLIFFIVMAFDYFMLNKKLGRNYYVGVGVCSLLWGGFYLFSLVLLKTWKQFDEIDVRLVGPAIPFIYFGLIYTYFYFKKNKSIVALKFVFILFALTSFFSGAVVYKNAFINFRFNQAQVFLAKQTYWYNNLMSRDTVVWMSYMAQQIKSLGVSQNTVIFYDGNNSITLSLLSGLPIKEIQGLNFEKIKSGKAFNEGVVLLTRSDTVEQFKSFYGSRAQEMNKAGELTVMNVVLAKLPLPE